jgi:hypothetical protein
VESSALRLRVGLPKQLRNLAFAYGARSAFDLSGFGVFSGRVFGSPESRPADPASTIAQDMGRVMDRFGRGVECGRWALEAGIEIEQLEPGCTDRTEFTEAHPQRPRRRLSSSRTISALR